MEKLNIKIPGYVVDVASRLASAGFQAYLVGGSLRDILLGKLPLDYDIATDATVEQMSEIFKNAKYVGAAFGTVVVPYLCKKHKTHHEVEVTTFRVEREYEDYRHPSKVEFVKDIHADLSRRDFTINAMAARLDNLAFGTYKVGDTLYEYEVELIDDYSGLSDLKRKVIRAVGDPNERFSEDPLRIIRACRFRATLEFEIEKSTFEAMKRHVEKLRFIAVERFTQELVKLLDHARKPSLGIDCLLKIGALKIFIPELVSTVGVEQPLGHIHDVYTHTLKVVDAAPPGVVRIAALFHDIAKPQTARDDGHFYGHDIKGAKMTEEILRRLKFPKSVIKKVVTLVKEHMFYYLPGTWTDSAVRRFIRRVGQDNIEDLFALRIADAKVNPESEWEPKELKMFREHIRKVLEQDNAFKVTDLKVNGHDLMREFNLKPGPIIGEILRYLLERVLDDPKLNKKEKLIELAREYLAIRQKS